MRLRYPPPQHPRLHLAEDSEEYTDLIIQLAENEKESALLLIRCAEGGPVSLYLEYPESGKIENKEAKAFTQVLSGYFERARFAAQGITDSQQELLAAEGTSEDTPQPSRISP